MNKIFLIIQREYLTRVKKKSFIVMTIIGPVLMGSIFLVPLFLSQVTDEKKTIAVLDNTGIIENKIQGDKGVDFVFVHGSVEQQKKDMARNNYSALLVVPDSVKSGARTVALYFDKQPSVNVVEHIREEIQKSVETDKLVGKGIDEKVLEETRTHIWINSLKVTETGDEASSSDLVTAIGFIGGFLIYLFIFLYGAQVMRGIIEEKTNRIVEVIISSVKPFQLMMGKIVGIALVGLTQFLLWVILTGAIKVYAQQSYMKSHKPASEVSASAGKDKASEEQSNDLSTRIFDSLKYVNITQIILVFIFYFIGGYLLYGALFAAVGSAVDAEADTQQFMLPITIPLILSFMIAQYVITSPDGPIAFWFSIIPFTSPVVMMVRIPFGVPVHELLISMAALILGFLGTTWLAARIYRTGILMYGKKPSYKEIGKWLFYKG